MPGRVSGAAHDGSDDRILGVNSVLPISVRPRPDESVESWLEHLADANGLTTAQLLARALHERA